MRASAGGEGPANPASSGSAYRLAQVRMGNQGAVTYRGEWKVKVIADTSPVLSLRFHSVSDLVARAKRVEVSIGSESVEGIRMHKLSATDVPIQGR